MEFGRVDEALRENDDSPKLLTRPPISNHGFYVLRED